MPTINLRTPIPGPKSQDLMRRRNAAVARGVAHATPIFAARAEGAMLEDVDGNRYIDFAGGIGCVNVGHRAPGVLAAIRGQLDAFLHTCFSVAPYGKYIELAEKLNSLTPGKFPKKTILVNSGAEAIENSIKIARSYTHRPAIICFEDAFHGRTMLTMSLTSKTHPYKAGFEPFASDIYRIPYAYCYRCSYSLKYPDCGVFCAKHLEDTFKRVVASGDSGRSGCRTGARRRRVCCAAAGVLLDHSGHLQAARDFAHCRRSANRFLPDRCDVRLRAIRRRARPAGVGKIDSRRDAARGSYGPC